MPTPLNIMTRAELQDEVSWLRKQVKKLTPRGRNRRIVDMTPEELVNHMRHQIRFIHACQTEDTIGSMLIVFGSDCQGQYASTVSQECAPAALRELADRLERREDTPLC